MLSLGKCGALGAPLRRSAIQLFYRLVLAISRWHRIVTVRIGVTDRSVRPMDHKFGLLVSRNLSPGIYRVALRRMDAG